MPVSKKLSDYFRSLGRKGGKGCSDKKLAHLKRLAESRRKKVTAH